MDKLIDELLIEILNFSSSSVDYNNFCHAIYREPREKHMLKLHSKVEIGGKGNIRTFLDNKLHSINDEPAVIWEHGKEWYQNDKLHRDDDKPAIIHIDGTKCWYKNGKLQRDDKPAIICWDGTEFWFINGKMIKKE